VSLVSLKNVSVTMGSQAALNNVSISIEPGEITTIVGPNGSGKTTLLRLVIGALAANSGEVIRAPGLNIGYVPQALKIDATLPMTVTRFLSLPKRHTPEDTSAALARAGAGHIAERQIMALSGGQFQRVLLARALLDQPQLLILDEPTTGLDQPGAAAFYHQIEEVRRSLGCAVLMVSHDLHVVMSASDKVICLNGHVCCHGTPEVVASAPEYRELFGTGTQGTLALYKHDHRHAHSHENCDHEHDLEAHNV
jgi:zinc transport system ATP-binding protein